MKADSKILSVNDLKIGYVSGKMETVLLPPLNASARRGELIAVIGKNGIGKSTLLRTLIGLQPSLGGEIHIAGENLKNYSRIKLAHNIGYISTEIVKVTNMNVYDLVALGRFPYTNWMGNIESKDHEAIIDALEKTSMKSFISKFISELSDGERQKAMIARILAQDTEIMIMDEPTAFLDVGSKYEIFHLLNMLSGMNNKTVIYSTHDLQMALSQSDKIWLILDDRLIEGAPEDLMISGAFDHLFDSSKVKFNSEDGTFSFRNESKGNIYLEGNGKKRHWTLKAINRAGYRVSKAITDPYITIPSDNDENWKLINGNVSKEFNSLYDLIMNLKMQPINPS